MALFAVVAVLGLQGCLPPADGGAEEVEPALTAEELKRRETACLIALSNATEYYKNGEYQSSVRNFLHLADLGCGEEYASDIYLWFGRAYLELGKVDSAVWAFQQGLRYLPEDKNLLKNIAYSLGRTGDTERQIYFYERFLEVDPENTEIYDTLAELLRKEGRSEDLIRLYRQWLKIEPDNARVQSELIIAIEETGKNPISFLRQRYEENPGNVQWGIDYAKALVNDQDYNTAIRVMESVIQRNPNARAAYQALADAALDQGEVDRAISALERLFQLNRTDHKVAMELSRAYLRKGAYPQSLEWAETAVKVSNDAGEAFYVRGDVYYTAADECLNSRDNSVSTFQDKLVFRMAYEDYQSAVGKGYRQAQTRADFLEKNLIPTKGDWFLQPADLRVFKPQGGCYSWITRTVRRP